MTIMATTITVACNFRVERNLGPTRKAKETMREYRELLEAAGITILQTLIIPAANHIDFVIDAVGLDAAKMAFAEAGITVSMPS